jgi:hypothetical protein
MTKFFTLIALLLTFIAIVAGQSTRVPSTKLKLSHVPDADFGCGCYLSRSKSELEQSRYLFVGPMDDPAYLNLNGKTIRLRQVGGNTRRDRRIGDRFRETYAGDGVTVRIDYVVTRICDPNDENCESTDYKTRLTVRRGKQVTVLNGFGVCGC